MTLPGGTGKEFTYDPLMRITEMTSHDPGGNQILNSHYTYDKIDNITARQTDHGSYQYDYDDLDRLTAVDSPAVAGLTDEAFTYDGVGNRLSSAEAAGDWTYNSNNELLSLPGLSGQTSPVQYEYDANGNLIQKAIGTKVTSYVYNSEDRLVQVWDGEPETGSLTASYYYDPFGRRLWKEAGGIRTYYHYADEGLVAEMDAAGNVTKSYGWQPGSTWGTDPLFMRAGGEYYFYHNDHLGTPQKLTASNGAVVWSAYYFSFGKAHVAPESTVVNNLRFPGQYFDQETGLCWNLWRYYDPEIGRYLRVDPIGLAGGINLFVYVGNNPINRIDPYGEVTCTYSISDKKLSCIIKGKCGDDILISCDAKSGNNDPNDQCAKDLGPIPTGTWKIDKPDARKYAKLTPYPGTNESCPKPRTLLRIHGWGTSTGCIAIHLNSCRDTIMNALKDEGGGILKVTKKNKRNVYCNRFTYHAIFGNNRYLSDCEKERGLKR